MSTDNSNKTDNNSNSNKTDLELLMEGHPVFFIQALLDSNERNSTKIPYSIKRRIREYVGKHLEEQQALVQVIPTGLTTTSPIPSKVAGAWIAALVVDCNWSALDRMGILSMSMEIASYRVIDSIYQEGNDQLVNMARTWKRGYLAEMNRYKLKGPSTSRTVATGPNRLDTTKVKNVYTLNLQEGNAWYTRGRLANSTNSLAFYLSGCALRVLLADRENRTKCGTTTPDELHLGSQFIGYRGNTPDHGSRHVDAPWPQQTKEFTSPSDQEHSIKTTNTSVLQGARLLKLVGRIILESSQLITSTEERWDNVTNREIEQRLNRMYEVLTLVVTSYNKWFVDSNTETVLTGVEPLKWDKDIFTRVICALYGIGVGGGCSIKCTTPTNLHTLATVLGQSRSTSTRGHHYAIRTQVIDIIVSLVYGGSIIASERPESRDTGANDWWRELENGNLTRSEIDCRATWSVEVGEVMVDAIPIILTSLGSRTGRSTWKWDQLRTTSLPSFEYSLLPTEEEKGLAKATGKMVSEIHKARGVGRVTCRVTKRKVVGFGLTRVGRVFNHIVLNG